MEKGQKQWQQVYGTYEKMQRQLAVQDTTKLIELSISLKKVEEENS